jgi:crotonobetainyl-CoA:carnitine CoA-transferase CaiB-like acyl-CoA transferase
VTGFGAGGPLADKHGFDGIGQAMSGAVYLSGTPDQPIALKLPWVDFGTACLSAVGTLAALIERGKTGRGQRVEGALLRTAIAFANASLIEQALTAVNRVATVNRGFNSAPADFYRCTDGCIVTTVIGPAMFRRWTRMIGEDHWLSDPRFADDQSRANHGEIISARMTLWCAERTCAAALGALEEASIVAGQLYSPQQALDDAHIRAAHLLGRGQSPGARHDVSAGADPDRAFRNPRHLPPSRPLVGRTHRPDP